MRSFLAGFILIPTLAFGQVIERLTPFGCQFLAAASACVAQENNKKVKDGFCKESIKAPLETQKEVFPEADFSLIEDILKQEMTKVKVLKLKKDQEIYNEVFARCVNSKGLIKDLLNKGV